MTCGSSSVIVTDGLSTSADVLVVSRKSEALNSLDARFIDILNLDCGVLSTNEACFYSFMKDCWLSFASFVMNTDDGAPAGIDFSLFIPEFVRYLIIPGTFGTPALLEALNCFYGLLLPSVRVILVSYGFFTAYFAFFHLNSASSLVRSFAFLTFFLCSSFNLSSTA